MNWVITVSNKGMKSAKKKVQMPVAYRYKNCKQYKIILYFLFCITVLLGNLILEEQKCSSTVTHFWERSCWRAPPKRFESLSCCLEPWVGLLSTRSAWTERAAPTVGSRISRAPATQKVSPKTQKSNTVNNGYAASPHARGKWHWGWCNPAGAGLGPGTRGARWRSAD